MKSIYSLFMWTLKQTLKAFSFKLEYSSDCHCLCVFNGKFYFNSWFNNSLLFAVWLNLLNSKKICSTEFIYFFFGKAFCNENKLRLHPMSCCRDIIQINSRKFVRTLSRNFSSFFFSLHFLSLANLMSGNGFWIRNLTDLESSISLSVDTSLFN